MTLLDIISNSCPLILCSLGALYSEFAGVLALFLEGMICLSGFLFFLFSTLTQNVVLGFLLTLISGSLAPESSALLLLNVWPRRTELIFFL